LVMTVECSKLVVLPEDKGVDSVLDQESALELAASLVDARPPEGYGEKARKAADDLPLFYDPLFDRAQEAVEEHVFDSDLEPVKRWEKLEENRGLIVRIVRGLLDKQIEVEGRLQDLEVFRPDARALDYLECLGGRFEPEVVYRAHPARDDYFVPIADFHPNMLRDKKAEFTDIATALGAKEIRIAASESQERRGAAEAQVDDPTNQADGGVEVEGGASESQSFGLTARFEAPNQPPQEPRHTHWLQREPMWRSMVQARLTQWVTEYRVNFSYTSDFGVNAEVAASVQQFGLGIGGEYQSKEELDEEYIVEFWPKSAY
jgi:hypothetical protein